MVFAILDVLLGFQQSAIPEDVLAAAGHIHYWLPDWTIWIIFISGIINILSASVGFIGVLLLRRWSRYCLLLATVLAIMEALLFSWNVSTGMADSIGHLSSILQGILLFIAFSKQCGSVLR
jgi:hypothetical protein